MEEREHRKIGARVRGFEMKMIAAEGRLAGEMGYEADGRRDMKNSH